MRPAFLVDVPTPESREGQTSGRACIMKEGKKGATPRLLHGHVRIHLDDDDFDEDSDEDDDFDEDDEEEEDADDEDEPETWQVVAGSRVPAKVRFWLDFGH